MDVPSFLQSKQIISSNGSSNRSKSKLAIIVLVILLLAIPLTVWLAQKTAIFSPKAAVNPIELVTGNGSCVTSTNPNKVSCATFSIKLTSPLGPPPSTAP